METLAEGFDLIVLADELRAAGIAVDGLGAGQDPDTGMWRVHAYDADGQPAPLPKEAAAIVKAHAGAKGPAASGAAPAVPPLPQVLLEKLRHDGLMGELMTVAEMKVVVHWLALRALGEGRA